jgi:hypothetical protein
MEYRFTASAAARLMQLFIARAIDMGDAYRGATDKESEYFLQVSSGSTATGSIERCRGSIHLGASLARECNKINHGALHTITYKALAKKRSGRCE